MFTVPAFAEFIIFHPLLISNSITPYQTSFILSYVRPTPTRADDTYTMAYMFHFLSSNIASYVSNISYIILSFDLGNAIEKSIF